MKYFLFAFTVMFCTSCVVKPKGEFNITTSAAAPDYSKEIYWAALPNTIDEADKTPEGLSDGQKDAEVDVFFLHPTIYTGKKGEDRWNGPVDDSNLNNRVDESTIRYQASIFNAVGKVYAPRYRQAHLSTYKTEDTLTAKKVFELAYSDVKNAFEYYLENFNNGRPIIIASHSQGTTHSRRLIKEYFDGTSLQKQFVVGYLVGIPVLKNEFEQIPVCQTPDQTGCFTSWRTFKKGYIPKKYTSANIAVTNPLSWTTDEKFYGRENNSGAILRNFLKIKKEICSAQIVSDQGILWTKKPKFFGNFLLLTRNYHIADFNLYYLDVRENAALRVSSYFEN